MKINPQLPLSGPSGLTTHQQDNFADWLQSPAHDTNGDEYYRLHQHHLQQSALSFKAIITQPNQQQVINEPNLPNAHNQSYLAPSDSYCMPDIKPQEAWQSTKNNKIMTHQNPMMAERLLSLKITIAACLANLDKPLMPQNTSLCSNDAISDKPRPFNTAITPTYQLFLNGNNAELALNTQQLSKQDIHDLHTLIKQVLTTKGYYLSKLIINGVTQ